VLPLWLVLLSISLMYVKEPFARWVERSLMGFDESVESQENRIGVEIRSLIRREQFSSWVSEILAPEIKAHWARFESTPRADAVSVFEVPGSEPMCLSFGRRFDVALFFERPEHGQDRGSREILRERVAHFRHGPRSSCPQDRHDVELAIGECDLHNLSDEKSSR
jgi:hypothetical protein